MSETLIPFFGMLFVFGFPVAAYIINRSFRHQERMELLKRGIIPPPDIGDQRAYKAWRRSGAPWPPPGVTPPVPPPGWTAPEDDPQRALFRGIRTAFVGLAILIGLSFIGGTPGTREFHGGPWLLGGLIPMFVGIAQMIIALLSGAVLPGVMQGGVQYGSPPSGTGPQQPPPSGGFTGNAPPPPWAAQPGRLHFEELSKPVNPPDLR